MKEMTVLTPDKDDLFNKLRSAEVELSAAQGPFALFVLVERASPQDTWDLVVSASWCAKNRQRALAAIVDALQARLSAEELLGVSRIVILHPSDPFVRSWRQFSAEHGCLNISNLTIEANAGTLHIDHAYLITSNPKATASQRTHAPARPLTHARK